VILTNRYSLPAAFAKAVAEQREHKPRTISITELIKPPRVLALERLHDAEVEMDVSDFLPQWFGSACHGYLDRYAKGTFSEQTLSVEVDGWTVHGTPDSLEWLTVEDAVLIDWKTTLVRSLAYEREEWVQQTNLYAHLARLCGLPPVSSIRVWAFLRDWDAMVMARDPEYPRAGVVRRDIALWSEEAADAYFHERLAAHRAAQEDGELPYCTDEERWKRSRWALTAVRNQKATRLFDTEDEAWAFAEARLDSIQVPRDWYTVEKRVGEPVRCARFCRAAPWCGQYQAELERDRTAALA
jgi:hypothetical protein